MNANDFLDFEITSTDKRLPDKWIRIAAAFSGFVTMWIPRFEARHGGRGGGALAARGIAGSRARTPGLW